MLEAFFNGQNVWIKIFIDVSLESTVFCFSDMWERECVCVYVGMIIVQIISAAICIHVFVSNVNCFKLLKAQLDLSW